MKKLYVILTLIILILLSAIYPLINYYADKTIPAIPPHNTYDEALGKILPDSINAKAKEHNCRYYIIPVEQVMGETLDFPSIKEDVNLALFSYSGWKVRVNQHDADLMKRHIEERNRRWGSMLNPEELGKMLSKQVSTEANTRYIAIAQLSALPHSKNNNLMLIVTINNFLNQSKVFEVKIPFVHPKTLQQWKDVQTGKKEYLATLSNRADFSINMMKIFGGILVLFLLFISTQKLIKSGKNRSYAKYLRNEIAKRQQLVDNGHFVAAVELAEKYLKVFPDDTEIIAFRDRVLDFTNNDPKKAQIAFVEAKKLQTRLNMAQDDPMQSFLSLNEKEELKALLPYNPHLKKNYLALVSAEESVKEVKETEQKTDAIKKFIGIGKLSKAEEELNSLYVKEEFSDTIDELKIKLRDKKEKAENIWSDIIQQLRNGKRFNVAERLKEIFGIWSDMDKAVKLNNDMKLGEGLSKFRIKTDEKDIQIYCGSKFTLGREDEDVKPDIILNDKRVSRPHAKIYFDSGKVVVEDLNSTVGTYVNGESISKKNLRNNDVLTLAKVLDFTVFIYDRNGNSCVLMRGDNSDIVLLSDDVEFEIINEKIKLGNGNNFLRYLNNVLILLTDKNIFVLFSGQEIIFDSNKFIVETIK